MPGNDGRPTLRLAPAAEPDPFAPGDDVSPAGGRFGSATLHDWARMCWPRHLCAVIAREAGEAAEAGVITLAEAESLVARLTVVIDQAIGVDER